MNDENKKLILGMHEIVEHLRQSLMSQDLEIKELEKKLYNIVSVHDTFVDVMDKQTLFEEAIKSIAIWIRNYMGSDGKHAMEHIRKMFDSKEVKTDILDGLSHVIGRVVEKVEVEVCVEHKDLEEWFYHLNRILGGSNAIQKVKKGIKRYLDEHKHIKVRLNS